MTPPLTEVLDNPGFKAIAGAVRRATVSAQAMKAMNKDYREIRYDLLPELRRKEQPSGAKTPHRSYFEFISMYNVENARRREMDKPAPRNITTEEFAAFVALVESSLGASTIGAMLCVMAPAASPARMKTTLTPTNPLASSRPSTTKA